MIQVSGAVGAMPALSSPERPATFPGYYAARPPKHDGDAVPAGIRRRAGDLVTKAESRSGAPSHGPGLAGSFRGVDPALGLPARLARHMQGGAHRLVLRGGEHDRLLRAFSRGDRPMAAGSSAVARDPVAMRRPQTRSDRPLKADRQALSGVVLRQVRAKSAPSRRAKPVRDGESCSCGPAPFGRYCTTCSGDGKLWSLLRFS